MSPEILNSTIHLHHVRKDNVEGITIKNSYLQFFPCWWPKLTPHQQCLFQHILWPCRLHYLVNIVLTVEEISVSISSWISLLLLMLLDMAWSKPIRIVGIPLFIEGHNSGGLLKATDAWAREVCKSCTDWAESWWTLFSAFWEFFLSKRSW